MFQRGSGQRGRHVRDRGASAVEYGLILSGVALATAVAIIALRPVLASALGSASDSQAVLSDGSTATPPAGAASAGGGTTATPTPTTATPTPTTATPTPTTPTPPPTPTQPAGTTAIVPGAAHPVQIDIHPSLSSGHQLTTCTFAPALKPATAKVTYHDITQTDRSGRVTSIAVTFSAPSTAAHGQAITATCTYSTSGRNPRTTTQTFSLWIS